MMNPLFDENEQDFAKRLCIRDAKGLPAVRIGLLATVFFEHPSTRAVREAVADAAEDYLQQFRAHLRWAKHPKTAHLHPIGSKRVRSPREWLPQEEDGEGWEFGFHGGESEYAASDFQVRAFGSHPYRPEDVMKDLGYFQIYLPLLWFADHPGTFPEVVLNLCRRIRPVSGYGGLGVLEALDVSTQMRNEPAVLPFAERFPGLEVEALTGHLNYVGEGIKGVNWLTILGERWLEAAGGLDYLRVQLDEGTFPFYRYDGGVMIQAGPKPQIGDVQANRWPRHYVTLAKVLKKIQIKTHWSFHHGGPGRRMHDAESLAWLFRFDGKE